MKKIFIFLILFLLLQGCSEQEDKAGSKECFECLFETGVERGVAGKCDKVCGRK